MSTRQGSRLGGAKCSTKTGVIAQTGDDDEKGLSIQKRATFDIDDGEGRHKGLNNDRAHRVKGGNRRASQGRHRHAGF